MISQVVLSFALPAPMIALVMFTRRKDIMGAFVNSRLTDYRRGRRRPSILALNVMLLLADFRRRHSGPAGRLRGWDQIPRDACPQRGSATAQAIKAPVRSTRGARRAPAGRPEVLAVGFGNGQVVDAGDAPAHQAILVELP